MHLADTFIQSTFQRHVHIFVMKFRLFPVLIFSCFLGGFFVIAISVYCICVLYHIMPHELSFKTVIEYVIKFESGKNYREKKSHFAI